MIETRTVVSLWFVGALVGFLQVQLSMIGMLYTHLSTYSFFVVLLCWLLGGVFSRNFERIHWIVLLLASVIITTASDTMSSMHVSYVAITISVVGASVLAGATATRYLVLQVKRTGAISRVFLHEHLGFLTGWLMATILLFVAAGAIVMFTIVLFLIVSFLWLQDSRQTKVQNN